MSADETLSGPWSSQQDGAPARLALDLLERYHACAQALRVLAEEMACNRKMGQFSIPVETIEGHRVMVTGLFNTMARMLFALLISPEMFALVIPKRGAQLWLENVAPLDHAIRVAAARRDGTEVIELGGTVIEAFYDHYARTGAIRIPVPHAAPAVPALAH